MTYLIHRARHPFKPRIQIGEDEDNESARSDDAEPQLRASE
jgi:hypothetical protein